MKAAIITGGGAGIGRAAALRFARDGIGVTVADIDGAGAEETVSSIEKAGGKAVAIRTDVSKDDDVAAMVDKTLSTFGSLDYAFNNAGIEGHQEPVHALARADWERVIVINLTGTWLCMKYELTVMRERGSGAIVNNASIAGLVGFTSLSHYVASKHGVIGLTRAAALEAGPLGIRVNALCPGVIETAMVKRAKEENPEMIKAVTAAHPLHRVGQPEEVAELAWWLCTGAPFMTGCAIPIDGGYTAQ